VRVGEASLQVHAFNVLFSDTTSAIFKPVWKFAEATGYYTQVSALLQGSDDDGNDSFWIRILSAIFGKLAKSDTEYPNRVDINVGWKPQRSGFDGKMSQSIASNAIVDPFEAASRKAFEDTIANFREQGLDSIKNTKAPAYITAALEALQKGAKSIVEEYSVEANWVSQFDQMFPNSCCSDKYICCKCACDEILSSTETSTDRTQQIIAASSSNKDCSNITASTDFPKTLQIIDKSLKEHKLPIMVGVHHPTPIKDERTRKIIGWEETCSSNTPMATNHYVVIVGKQYDKTKKLHYYLFYEVGTEDDKAGKSSDNRLYIYGNLVKGTTKYKENIPTYYYILTEIRKNINKTY
jgi:hypothetical protein